MKPNSPPSPDEYRVNFAFVLGLLVGLSIALWAGRERAATPQHHPIDRRARNAQILSEVLNEVEQP